MLIYMFMYICVNVNVHIHLVEINLYLYLCIHSDDESPHPLVSWDEEKKEFIPEGPFLVVNEINDNVVIHDEERAMVTVVSCDDDGDRTIEQQTMLLCDIVTDDNVDTGDSKCRCYTGRFFPHRTSACLVNHIVQDVAVLAATSTVLIGVAVVAVAAVAAVVSFDLLQEEDVPELSCIGIHIHVCIYILIYINIHSYLNTNMHTCTYIHMYAYTCIYIYAEELPRISEITDQLDTTNVVYELNTATDEDKPEGVIGGPDGATDVVFELETATDEDHLEGVIGGLAGVTRVVYELDDTTDGDPFPLVLNYERTTFLFNSQR
jgi:hypothetical protein